MKCQECLIWRNALEGNKERQLNTTPALIRIGFTDVSSLNQLYRYLDTEFRRLISIMDNDCADSRCILVV